MTFETIRTMLIGYARVSTTEQTLDLQKDALEKIGCTKIYSDVVSGAKAERKGLQEALEYVREGDTLVVWRLDRLGRSLKHLIETITRLNNRKIGFKSITENIDTTTSGGKLVFHIFGALAEFGFDHGVGHSLLLLYSEKAPNCKNSNKFNALGNCPSNTPLCTFCIMVHMYDCTTV
jgi:hypothetical protein